MGIQPLCFGKRSRSFLEATSVCWKTGNRQKTGEKRDIPKVFSQKVKENKCNVPSVPGLSPNGAR